MEIVEPILVKVDAMIRAGQVREARMELRLLERKKLSHTEREKLASLYRRLNLHKMALNILRPVVVGYGRKLPESSSNAKIEYGAALIQMDLVEQGRKFLTMPEVSKNKEARRWYALSFLHDSQLSRAAEEIQKILPEFDPESYEYLVLKVNLMVALLATLDDPKKLRVFEGVSKEVEAGIEKHHAERLRSAFVSLSAQGRFFSKSVQSLAIDESEPKDYLDFFKRFTSVFHEGQAGRISLKSVYEHYERLRMLAQEKKWFEAVREIDLHFARTFRKDVLPYVKMGSRLEHYQAKFLDQIETPLVYCYSRKEKSEPSLKTVFTIQKMPGAPKVRELFQLLYQEQYAPVSSFTIWSVLAKDEYYVDPHSTNRIHQWVKRLKAWLKKSKIPATLESSKSGYRLVPKAVLACSQELLKFVNVDSELLNQLFKEFPNGKLFSIHDASKLAAGVGTREFQYRFKSFVENGQIERIGKARAVRYRVLAK